MFVHEFSIDWSSNLDSSGPVVGMDFVALDLCLAERRLHSVDWTFGVPVDLVRHMDLNHSVWNHRLMNANEWRLVNRRQHSSVAVTLTSV